MSRTKRAKRAKRVTRKVPSKRKSKRISKRMSKGKDTIITEQVVSMRHKAHLLYPDRPFQIQRSDLLSTAIKEHQFNFERLILKIVFWKVRIRNKRVVSRSEGGTYLYFGISTKLYEEFLQASSKGRFFYYRIRNKYQFRRVK